MIVVGGDNLKSGSTKSCGCLAKEIRSKIHKKYNQYDLSGEYGIGWTSNTNEEFYFDLEDFYVGRTKKLRITRHIYCRECNGTGNKDKIIHKCNKCNDQNNHHNRMGNFFLPRSFCIICHYAATSPFLPM